MARYLILTALAGLWLAAQVPSSQLLARQSDQPPSNRDKMNLIVIMSYECQCKRQRVPLDS